MLFVFGIVIPLIFLLRLYTFDSTVVLLQDEGGFLFLPERLRKIVHKVTEA